ncbi:uncharacterized protein LOC141602116 [Silene latifolia]|uniref:uncharacterized protein LOC141602116 n=1 Tax=Silene latifolia TaxID=37657 RepID=UPI003D78ACAC
MATGYVNSSWLPDAKGYSIRSGYCWLQGMNPSVSWYSEVWDNWCVPKHSFIGWLIKHEALNMKEKLHKLHLTDNDCCILCAAGPETHMHLFKSCSYSKQILSMIEDWMQIKLEHGIQHGTELQRHACRMAQMACWYYIWLERNKCRIELKLMKPACIVKDIRRLVHTRINQFIRLPLLNVDKTWVQHLDILC